jgi:hypothetical protein
LASRLLNKFDREVVPEFSEETGFFAGKAEDVLTVFLNENDPKRCRVKTT